MGGRHSFTVTFSQNLTVKPQPGPSLTPSVGGYFHQSENTGVARLSAGRKIGLGPSRRLSAVNPTGRALRGHCRLVFWHLVRLPTAVGSCWSARCPYLCLVLDVSTSCSSVQSSILSLGRILRLVLRFVLLPGLSPSVKVAGAGLELTHIAVKPVSE